MGGARSGRLKSSSRKGYRVALGMVVAAPTSTLSHFSPGRDLLELVAIKENED